MTKPETDETATRAMERVERMLNMMYDVRVRVDDVLERECVVGTVYIVLPGSTERE